MFIIFFNMKGAVSLINSIFEIAKKITQCLGISLSGFQLRVVSVFIVEHNDHDITEALNKIYSKETSSIDSILQNLQIISMQNDYK